jgi:hypothetical protein
MTLSTACAFREAKKDSVVSCGGREVVDRLIALPVGDLGKGKALAAE